MTSAHSLINQLVQLQGLIVARMQKKVSMPNARLEELETLISSLGAGLSQPVKSHFNRLLQRYPEAIVPAANGNCTGCGMALTKSLIQSVVKAEQLNRCPNCTRFLYDSKELVERERRVTRAYGEVRKTGISRYTSPELMVVPLKGRTAEEALGGLCDRLASNGFANNPAQLLELAIQRETIVSTAAHNGLAFPHVRGVEGGGLAMAVGISRKGIKFGGQGRSLTRLFFFVVIPTAMSEFYLRLTSGLSRTFREKEAREVLLKAADEKALWKALVQTTQCTFASWT